MLLEQSMTLDQLIDLEAELKARKMALASKQRDSDCQLIRKLHSVHEFSAEELNFFLPIFKMARKTKGATIPVKYYDPLTGSHWSGNGSAPAAFAESSNHDKANPVTNPKRMDQYLIPDREFGVQIALKIKKNVRTKSGLVINYADLIASSPTLSSTSIAT